MNIKVALDWTPNTIHSGFYIAKAKGWYNKEDISVSFISPEKDNYSVLPTEKLLRGEADFAIAPSECVIQDHVSGQGRLIAVAAVLQGNSSAFVTLKNKAKEKGIKKYAKLGIPYEEKILKAFVDKQPQFKGMKNVSSPKLETWEMLKSGEADLCWVYMPWEGVEATYKGIELDVYRMSDYGITYGHCPVLVTTQEMISDPHRAAIMADFLRITAAGYYFATEYPQETVDLLRDTAQHPAFNDRLFVQKSQLEVNKAALLHDGSWGIMSEQNWSAFIKWLLVNGCIDKKLAPGKIFTNRFLLQNELQM